MTPLLRPLIVGAGPAGIRAAEVLAKAGIRPLLVDEAPLGGGQIYRQRLVADERSPRDLYGSEARKATALHETIAALAGRVDYWPQALVWNIGGNVADIAVAGHNRRADFTHLVLATGATDRVLPFAGLDDARRLQSRRRASRTEIARLRHRRAGGVSAAPARCSTSSPGNT